MLADPKRREVLAEPLRRFERTMEDIAELYLQIRGLTKQQTKEDDMLHK